MTSLENTLPPSLPFLTAQAWLEEARALWRANWGFISISALLILVMRWLLDFGASGAAIFLSYFTDALLFPTIFMGLAAKLLGKTPRASLLEGWKSLAGKRRAVLMTGFVGMPSALVSSVLIFAAPSAAMAVAGIFGLTFLGSALLAGLGMLAGYVALFLLMAALLSSIRAAQDGCSLRVAALWGFGAAMAGWKPLASLFAVFLSAVVVASLLLPSLFGLAFSSGYAENIEAMEQLRYWVNWPGLFLALSLLLSLMLPIVRSLSREHARSQDPESANLSTDEKWGRFVAASLRRAGFGLRILAAGVACSAPFHGAMEGAGGAALPILGAAALWRWGMAFDRSSKAWRDESTGKWKRYEAIWYPGKLVLLFLLIWLLAASFFGD